MSAQNINVSAQNINNLDSAILENINSGVFAVNQDMEVVVWNRYMDVNSGHRAETIIGQNLFKSFPELPEKWLTRKIKNIFLLGNFSFTSWEQRPYLFKCSHNRGFLTGVRNMLQDSYFFPLKDQKGNVEYVCISIHDVTDTGIFQNKLKHTIGEQNNLIDELEKAKSQLQQSEKMAAIGQLAAGVAHEINNPLAFVASNLKTLNKYACDLLTVADHYEAVESELGPENAVLVDIVKTKQQTDFDYIKEDLSGLLEESEDGLQRIRQIVKDLKDFSRPDEGSRGWADLHDGIDSTLNVVNNEIKYKADIKKEYSDIPQVNCIIAQLNQVFMNLIVNAAQAIEEHGTIVIKTGANDAMVWVEISDTGKGVEPENLKRIFDPFFTTKPIGQGTGLGLSVSYGIIEKHQGQLEAKSELGKGTTFRISLPVNAEIEDNKKL